MWKIYKEGQGKWARGLLMFVVGLGALYMVRSLHQLLPGPSDQFEFLGWSLDYRWGIEAPLLIGAVVFGVWLFNHESTVDFLIDTESELKNKVTWPSKEQEINASVVVVVTVIVMMAFIVTVDFVFSIGRDLIYPGI